jgi:hypothetical protein
LVGIVGVVLAATVILSSGVEAATPRTSTEPSAIRWSWFDGPYHGNPDEPGPARPSTLSPTERRFWTLFVKLHMGMTLRVPTAGFGAAVTSPSDRMGWFDDDGLQEIAR